MQPPYRDRRDAGRALAALLVDLADRPDVIVLALPRALNAPLDVFLVRKLGVPGREELAMGAIATGGVRLLNADVVRGLRIDESTIDRVAAEQQAEMERRALAYRDGRPAPNPRDKTVILVDDGLATGASMRAAVAALKRLGPASIVVAVPVAAASTCEEMAEEVDRVACVFTPEPFYAVGYWYDDFGQTTDDEVRDLLAQAAGAPSP